MSQETLFIKKVHNFLWVDFNSKNVIQISCKVIMQILEKQINLNRNKTFCSVEEILKNNKF